MDRRILRYLNSYSKSVKHEAKQIDRLLVTAFVTLNKLGKVKNTLVSDYCIKDKDADYPHLCEFLDKEQTPQTIEELIEVFEFVISPEDKIVTGAVYTPYTIRKFIIDNIFGDARSDITICDPACGCGGFLISAAKELKRKTALSYKTIFENNLFGLDIHEYSTTRTKLLLSLMALEEGEDEKEITFNLFVGNALNFEWSKHLTDFKGFSMVIGNPPYVASRNIDEESKVLLSKWSVCNSGHPDLYIPFFEIGLNWLKDGGTLGYITMNTFFKSLNGKALRNYFHEISFRIKILDFGSTQVFQSKSTYTCICLIEKIVADKIQYKKVEDVSALRSGLNGVHSIPYLNLRAEEGWNLQNTEAITVIESTGTPFSELFTTRNGIATLMNEVYIFNAIKTDDRYFYLQRDDWVYPIEKSICKEVVNTNLLTQVDSITYIKEKIIFPYIYELGARAPVPMSEAFIKSNFPSAYTYLKEHKDLLAKRDKGGGAKYDPWFAYGRNQSLDKFKFKLFFPHITSVTPRFVLNDDEDLLFVNGLAAISDKKDDLEFVSKLLSTKLFWFYIINTSKPYGSGFYSLSKNYIKHFGVAKFTPEERKFIIKETNFAKVNSYIESRYNLKF